MVFLVPVEARRECWLLWNCHEPPCGSWESNLCALEKQPMLLNAELSLQLPKLNRYFNFLGVDPLSVYSEGIALCHLKGYNQLLSLLCLVVCCLLFWRGLFHSDSVPPIIFLNNFFRKCFLCSRQVLNSLCRMTFDLAALSSHALGLYSHILLCPTGAEHRASFMLSELHPILSSVLGMAGAGWGV